MKRNLALRHQDVLCRAKNWISSDISFFDVGAAKGDFTRMVNEAWQRPEENSRNVKFHLFEAAPYWESELSRVKDEVGNAYINNVAVGSRLGSCFFRFDENNPKGGALLDKPSSNKCIETPIITLDSYISKMHIMGPFVLKLDVHGAEKDILAGAKEFMKSCEVLILETYFFGPVHRRFAQMSLLLEEVYGMHCFDLAEPSWRDLDGALWQIDLYFAKAKFTSLDLKGIR